MKTLIVKGSDYSVLNVRQMENSKVKDVNVVLVYPTGYIYKIQTSLHKLITVTETLDSLIYHDIEVIELFNSYTVSYDG